MSSTELCALRGMVVCAVEEGARELEAVAEDCKEEEEDDTPQEEDTGIGLARTTGFICHEVFARFLLTFVAGDDVLRLTDLVMCGRLEVGTGGGEGGVALPIGVLSEVAGLPVFCFGRFHA